jgi:echinoderm microtubule-associated protein-like 6
VVYTDGKDGGFLVGTKAGDILTAGRSGRTRVVLDTHSEGELWGLATHPSEAQFATASEDRTLCLWDMKSRSVVQKRELECGGRSVAYFPDGTMVAVGLTNGGFVVAQTDDVQKTILSRRDRNGCIHALSVAPNGRYLAVGSHDGFVDFYDTAARFERVGYVKAAAGYGCEAVVWCAEVLMQGSRAGILRRLTGRPTAPTFK